MKWLTFALCLLTTTLTAQAQTQQNNLMFFTRAPCDPVDKMIAVLEDYGEELLFSGDYMTFDARTGQPMRGGLFVYVNQDTGTFSTMQVFADGMACLIGNGRNFSPFGGR